MQRPASDTQPDNPFSLHEAAGIAKTVAGEFASRLEPLFDSELSNLPEKRFEDDLIDGLMAFSEWEKGISPDPTDETAHHGVIRQFAYGFAHGTCMVAYEPEKVDAIPVQDIDEAGLREACPTPSSYDALRRWVAYRTLDIRAVPVTVAAIAEMRRQGEQTESVSESMWIGMVCGLAEGVSFATHTGVSQDGDIAYERPWEHMAFISMSPDTNPAPSTPTGRFMREMRMSDTGLV